MVEHTSGVICISMNGQDLDRLRLPLMVNSAENEEAMYTAFTITVDLKDGITTGTQRDWHTRAGKHTSLPLHSRFVCPCQQHCGLARRPVLFGSVWHVWGRPVVARVP